MKIVNLKQFLELPDNVLYAKYEPCFFGPLEIKVESLENDFFSQAIADSVLAHDSEEFSNALESSLLNGTTVAMDFYSTSRDGCFEDAQLFAVYDKEDVFLLIERLKSCIE
jgi:hypothetical protein